MSYDPAFTQQLLNTFSERLWKNRAESDTTAQLIADQLRLADKELTVAHLSLATAYECGYHARDDEVAGLRAELAAVQTGLSLAHSCIWHKVGATHRERQASLDAYDNWRAAARQQQDNSQP